MRTRRCVRVSHRVCPGVSLDDVRLSLSHLVRFHVKNVCSIHPRRIAVEPPLAPAGADHFPPEGAFLNCLVWAWLRSRIKLDLRHECLWSHPLGSIFCLIVILGPLGWYSVFDLSLCCCFANASTRWTLQTYCAYRSVYSCKILWRWSFKVKE